MKRTESELQAGCTTAKGPVSIAMNAARNWSWLLACVLCAGLQPLSASAEPTVTAAQPAVVRDGRHDFDWDIGAWKTHQRRLLHPLTGSTTWVEYEGTDVVRKIWDGANEGVVEADGPAGHLEIFTVRLYNPDAHQWSVNFANSTVGTMGIPTVGEFKDGRGVFYDQEPYNGRTILVRFSVMDITATTCRFEQAFSDDGGKTWETNFIVTETLVKDGSDKT
jgi:hypothetical protein